MIRNEHYDRVNINNPHWNIGILEKRWGKLSCNIREKREWSAAKIPSVWTHAERAQGGREPGFKLLYINNGSSERGAFPCERLCVPFSKGENTGRGDGRERKEGGGERERVRRWTRQSAACCTIVNTLHISRSIRGPSADLPIYLHRHLFSEPLSPSDLRVLYGVGLQLAKIDRVKVHDDGADRNTGFRLCVSGDARYLPAVFLFLSLLFFFFSFYAAPLAPFIIITRRNRWPLLRLFMSRSYFSVPARIL